MLITYDLLEYRRTDGVVENFPNTILSPSHAQITEKISAELFNSALSCLVVATNCTGDHQQSFQLDVDTDEMEFISFVVLKVIDESRANFGKFSKFFNNSRMEYIYIYIYIYI